MQIRSLKSLSLLISSTLFLNSCLPGSEDWKIAELYAQKIEGSSYILYKYDAWGGRDSHSSGYVLLDSTDNFSVNPDNDLPFIYLQEIPNKTEIKGVNRVCNNDCGEDYQKAIPLYLPIKTETTERKTIKITNLIYQYKGFGERTKSLESFQFERLIETRDSLFFYNLDDVEMMDGVHLDSLKFKKADVVVRLNRNKEISKIVIKNLEINKNTNEIMLCQPYFLTPKTSLNSHLLSDYGIFKEVIQ